MMTDYELAIRAILNNCIDFTKNGKCSNCGECCSANLPMSNKELKQIKQYVKKHNIKPHTLKIVGVSDNCIEFTCPFRNESENKCDIYKVRPWICQRFICNRTQLNTYNPTKKLKIVNMREIFK